MQTIEISEIDLNARSSDTARVKPSSRTAVAKAWHIKEKVDFNNIPESTWAAATVHAFDTLCSNGNAVGPKTFVRFLWNDDKLFFHVEVEKNASPCEVHSPELWHGSNIEFLISPSWLSQPCLDEYEFLFNSDGDDTVLHWRGKGLKHALQWNAPGLRWTCSDKPKFQKDLDCWCFVGEIDFSTFNVVRPAAGEYWGLGMFRKINPVSGPEKLLAWSPTHEDPPRFHRPEKFGILLFADSRENK